MNIDGYAFITGAGSGIGKQTAIAFAAEGAHGIALLDIDLPSASITEQACRTAATHPDFTPLTLHVDITDETAVTSAVTQTVALFGRIDYALNSSGIGVERPVEISEVDTAEFERFMKVNVLGSFLVTKLLSAAMKKQAVPAALKLPGDGASRFPTRKSIVLIGSANSLAATPHNVQYVASKHAVAGIVKTAALDLAPYGIRVNLLCPTWVEGRMVDRAVAGNPALVDLMKSAVPWGRNARVHEVSDMVVFLSSPRASYVTGSTVTVDGGTTLQVKI